MSEMTDKIKGLSNNRAVQGGLVLVAVALIGWQVYGRLTAAPPAAPQAPLVRTVTVGSSSETAIYTYPGEVRGRYESNLAFQVAGKVVSRNVSLGDTVSAGQVLLRIDPKDVQQAVEGYSAALASAEANYNLARDNAARYNTLYASGAVSKMVLDQYNTQLEAAEATLRQARAQLIAGQNQLGYTQLVADHDGVVAALNVEVGQVVAAGYTAATVVQEGAREVQIFVPENRLDTIKPNMPARVTFWALENTVAQGYISEIAPMADATTRTYKVRVAVNNMPAAAKLGMTAKVSLSGGSEAAMLVPTSALYQTGDTPQVWVVRDNRAKLVKVGVGSYEGSSIKITAGLKKGDVVVTGGLNKLAENMEVRLEGGEAK